MQVIYRNEKGATIWGEKTNRTRRICTSTVSYTHLDVYKRQVLGVIATLYDARVSDDKDILALLKEEYNLCLLYTSRCV